MPGTDVEQAIRRVAALEQCKQVRLGAESNDLRRRPRTERGRLGACSVGQRSPLDPLDGVGFVRIGDGNAVDLGEDDRAQLVLHRAIDRFGAVGEVTERQRHAHRAQRELVGEVADDRLAKGLAGPRVPATGVGPDAGKGPLRR